MRNLFLILVLLLILFGWLIHKSGTIERIEYKKYSDVPGGERTSVEYHWRWDRFEAYVKSLIPRR